jgi:hypothetical protein
MIVPSRRLGHRCSPDRGFAGRCSSSGPLTSRLSGRAESSRLRQGVQGKGPATGLTCGFQLAPPSRVARTAPFVPTTQPVSHPQNEPR